MNFLRIFLAILSIYRLAQLFVYDDGPREIFSKLRIYFGKRAAGKSSNNVYWNLAYLINCPYCLGIWFALIVSFLVIFPTVVGDLFILIFGIAGGQTFLQSRSER